MARLDLWFQFSVFTTTWLFICLALATEGFDWTGKALLGYRSVHPAQKDAYEAAGNTLTWDPSISTEEWGWYGDGVYLLRNFGLGWTPEKDDWLAYYADVLSKLNTAEFDFAFRFCMAYANEQALAIAPIIKMPGAKLEYGSGYDSDSSENCDDYTHEPLKGNRQLISDYILAVGGDADQGIRVIHDDSSLLAWEILIPPAQLNGNSGQLDIGVVCKKNKEDLPTLERVDVEAGPWEENSVGDWESWLEE
ncbi:uncharacterized protein N7459_009937 [Penicillium hispanicum]|uniref:uncharacterized protein n=1 Tax=Penicillium hispanicum TaxID=1080232 RepID=UPI00253FFF78|nr:uncharacterized protein N7459_009937 [Penicillium hispanicum]KAJ5570507.1 hypothetical protein N7459_009937 [Penicillium hispanicum]